VNKKYLKKLQRRFEVSPYFTKDDIEALCIEASIKAAGSYQPDRAVSFEVYEKMHMRWAVLRPFKEALELKALRVPTYVVTDDGEERELFELAQGAEQEDHADLMLLREALERFAETLDPIDHTILTMHLLGTYTMLQVGAHFGISKQAVHERVQKLLRRLQTELADWR
jgi:RNA polymerase sigma factor (sigma-70 family)